MKALAIFDNTGFVLHEERGTYIVPKGGVQYAEVEIPEGKRLVSFDMTREEPVPVYEDLPKSEIEVLVEHQALMQSALDELILGGAL